MDFTREPVVETVITPKEGFKLVVRSSKLTGQNEYFVDAIELVSFGGSLFYRSTDRSKPFLFPAQDCEVLEVREARMVLKNVGLRHITGERTIKIGGGKEVEEREEHVEEPLERIEEVAVPNDVKSEKGDRKKDKRRSSRRKRGKDDVEDVVASEPGQSQPTESTEVAHIETEDKIYQVTQPRPNLLVPPPSLISETLSRYRQNDAFKGAFYEKNGEEATLAPVAAESAHLEPSTDFDAEDDELFGAPRAPRDLTFIEELESVEPTEEAVEEPFGVDIEEDEGLEDTDHDPSHSPTSEEKEENHTS